MNFTFLKAHIPWIGNVFLILSILYFFFGIFFGLDFTDSFYHLNQALHPADDIYLYPFFLSSIIINTIVEIIGPEIIFLRLINSLLLFFSLLTPLILIKTQKPRAEVFFYIACVLFLFAPFNVNILGYDSLSIFILSLIFSLSILYLKSSKLYLLMLLSILCASAVFIRLPNLLVIPILFLIIGFNEKIRKGCFYAKDLKIPMIFLLLTLLWVYLGFFIYYSSVEEFFKASANSTSHDLKILFYHYFVHGIKLSLFISLIIGGHYFFKKFQHRTPTLLLYGILGLFYILFIGVFVFHSKYSQNYSLLLTSLTISILILQVLQDRKHLFSLKHMVLYLYFSFLFINPFGSNTGLLKAVSLFLLLPFVLSFNDLKFKQYWLLILIVLLPFSLIEKLYSTYEDSGILSLNTTLDLDLLKSINTNETRADFLKKIDREVTELKKNNVQVYFYGDKSHIFHYIYPDANMNINSFFQPIDDFDYYSKFEHVLNIKNSTAIFIVDSYPGKFSQTTSQLNVFLLSIGFKRVDAGQAIYYLRIIEK